MVIPRTDTQININNNILVGIMSVDNIETVFSTNIADGNYTKTELAAEIQLNDNLYDVLARRRFHVSVLLMLALVMTKIFFQTRICFLK